MVIARRIVKSPKLYFYDTGLLCRLLGINNEAALQKHSAYGAVFENWIISEIRNNKDNAAQPGGLYYFRDSAGNEVDLVHEREGEPIAIEIKSGSSLNSSMFRGLNYWQKLQPQSRCILLHGGQANEFVKETMSVIPWTEVANL